MESHSKNNIASVEKENIRKREQSSALLSTNRRMSGSCSVDEHLMSLSDDAGDTTERLKTEHGPANASETSEIRLQQFAEESD